VTTTSAPVRRRAIDLRLGTAGTPARGHLAVAVAAGLAQTVTVIVQAVLLATIIERCLRSAATLGELTPQLIGLGAAVVARGALGWVGEWVAQRTSATVGRTLRRRLLAHALELGPGWLAGERAGELALTSTRGVDAVGVYYGRYLPQLILAALCPVAVLGWVAYTDWASLLILLGLVALVPPAMVFFGRRATEATTRQWRRLSSLSAHLLELVQGLPTLRAFGRVDYGRREVVEASEGLRRSTLRTLRVAFLSSLALELLAGLGTGLVAMVLGLRLLDGHISLYVALAVLLVSPEVFLPLRRASAEFHASAEGTSAGERMAAVFATPSAEGVRAGAGAPPPEGPAPSIGLESVSVEFADRHRPALAGLSLRVEPAGRVALVGPSGSGKSTVLHAVLGLVPLSSGRILAGSVDLATVDADAWRRRVSWVPQRPHLFSGTVADNLRLGNPDAPQHALAAAIGIAGLHEVLDRLEAGLDTPVGEGGATLSSGERHRLAIARAVLHDGDIVLLDEVGSHLDPAARLGLRESLEPWLAGRTVIVAAHHPDVVSGLDAVVALGSPTVAGAPRSAGR
jgi:thiol reductant ABC exporter CydD subunit